MILKWHDATADRARTGVRVACPYGIEHPYPEKSPPRCVASEDEEGIRLPTACTALTARAAAAPREPQRSPFRGDHCTLVSPMGLLFHEDGHATCVISQRSRLGPRPAAAANST